MSLRKHATVATLILVLACVPLTRADVRTHPLRGTIDRFDEWVDLADRHRDEWRDASLRLTDEERHAAIRLADKLFRGTFRGYGSAHRGYDKANGTQFFSKPRVREASPVIVAPARSYLLWRIAVRRAESLRRALGVHGTDDSKFWRAFSRHMDHAVQLGFLSSRSAYVIPRVMAEAVLGDRLYDKGLIDHAAARAMLANASALLNEAIRRFDSGQVDEGVFFVIDAVRSMRLARGFGVPPGSMRDMLHRNFTDVLTSDAVVADYRGASLTFRDALQDGIGYWKAKSDRRRGFDLRPFTDFLLPAGDERIVARPDGLKEDVVVEASPIWLNFEGYALRELAVMVDDVAGRPVLKRYADVEILGKLLFAAVLHDKARPKVLERVRSACASRIAEEQGIQPTGVALTREITVLGHRVLAVPGVKAELARTLRGEMLLGRLSVLDSPDFHAHVGNLWVRRALTAGRDHQAWREARAAYLRAAERFAPGSVPPILYELADAAVAYADSALSRTAAGE